MAEGLFLPIEMTAHHPAGKNEIAPPLQHYRTFPNAPALVRLPNGKPASRPDGDRDGQCAQRAPNQDFGQHERACRFKLPRPCGASQGGSWRQNPVLGILGGLGGHVGYAAGKSDGGGEEAGGEGSGEAT